MEMMELRKVYRQENRHFLRLLDAIRLNKLDFEDLDDLNERYLPGFSQEGNFVTLSARNARVNSINKQAMDRIPLPGRTFMAKVTGQFPEHLFPTDGILLLKEGAQVMMIKNDPQKRFVNGTIGRIVAIADEKITVEVEEQGQSRKVEVEQMDWEIVRFKLKEDDPSQIKTETIGTFCQFPLKPAWAITIHKSQGQTFDKVIIDLGRGAFEHGQTYVALSRCRTLEGIVLTQPVRPRDVLVDERVVQFYETYF